ncbi:hypothetical protein RND81_01G159400 [Saponaria officinalis]|uniref:Uncharacterized protein n=1 Tax=Saponaria officinalis TaxID=3572 RepID=A0AAW1NHJ1_SAPOF
MFYADRTSIIYGEARFTWSQTYDRCRRLASAFQSLGVGKNDVELRGKKENKGKEKRVWSATFCRIGHHQKATTRNSAIKRRSS